MATTTRRTSRASRGAAAAQTDAAKTAENVVPITGAGKSVVGDNGHGHRPAAAAGPAAAAKPETAGKPAGKPEEPKPEIKLDEVPVTYHRPTVTFPDGRTVVCEHKYLHETAKAAAACGRKVAALGKFEK